MSALIVAFGLLLGAPPADSATATFDKLKALEGNWKTSDKEPKFVSLRVISNATAVLEMVTGADRTKVVSAAVYYLEGGKLVLAHYGAAGAPKLEVRAGGKLEFEGKGGAVTSVTLTAKGDDKLTHETVSSAGKVSLELTREYVDTLK